jgi:hypothetical protein
MAFYGLIPGNFPESRFLKILAFYGLETGLGICGMMGMTMGEREWFSLTAVLPRWGRHSAS